MTRAEKHTHDLLIKLKIPVYIQCIIGPYICDFVGVDRNFIIEVDGSSHDNRDEYDGSRDKFLTQCGFQVFRIENSEVSKPELLIRINQSLYLGAFKIRESIEKINRIRENETYAWY